MRSRYGNPYDSTPSGNGGNGFGSNEPNVRNGYGNPNVNHVEFPRVTVE